MEEFWTPDKEKKTEIKIKKFGTKTEKDSEKTREIRISHFKGINIKVEKETDKKLSKTSSDSSSDKKNKFEIRSLGEFEVKEKVAPSIKISKFNKIKVKDEYQPLSKSSFQSLIQLISGKIYNSFNYLNSLFDFYSFCNSKHTTNETIIILDKLITEAKNNFPDLNISQTIIMIKEKFEKYKQDDSVRKRLDLQFHTIDWSRQILVFGESNIKLYANSIDSNQEITKKIDWSLNTIKNNLKTIEKQYISNILTHIMVLLKTSGVSLSVFSFTGSNVLDSDLIGGFLTAIQSFGMEISKKETSAMKKISYQDFEIEIEDGDYVRIALILQGMPIPLLSQKLADFCKRFESKFSDELKVFKGDISVFEKDVGSIINEIFS